MPTPVSRRAFAAGIVALAPSTLSVAAAQEASAGPARAEVAYQLDQPLGNATFTPEGRLIVSHHPMFETDVRVSEVVAPGTLRPFPDARWNSAAPSQSERLDAVLGVRSDADGVAWLLDMGSRGQVPPKFVAWDTRANRLRRVLPITPAALGLHSEPNDFVLDARNGMAYIADEGVGREGDGSAGALIVVNLVSGVARRVLEGALSTRPESVPVMADGRPMVKRGEDGSTSPMRVGCDGIALDHRSEWLYYGPLNGEALYRVRVADLLDGSLSEAELGRRVEHHASRPVAGGITIDAEDNVYLTEVGGRAIGVVPARTRAYRRLAEHPDMLWPDGLTFGPDGLLYVTVAQLPRSAPLNGGTRGDEPPYLIMRTRPLAPGRVGT